MVLSAAPSFNVDRTRWNRAWEQGLARLYGSQDTPSYTGPSFIDRGTESMWDLFTASDVTVQITSIMVNEAAILQRNLTRDSALRLAENNFESEWKNCTSETREKWILEGLVRVCQAHPDFEQRRLYCPEVTLLRLNSKGKGQPFLDLLRALCLDDLDTVPSNPKPLPSDAFDRFIGYNISTQNRGCQLFQLSQLTKRTHFLVMFVWNILLAFHGESHTFRLQKLASVSSFKPELQQLAKQMGIRNKDMKEMVSELRSKGVVERSCQNCLLPPSMIEGVTALVACSRCKSIGRLVFYCGRSCQVNDYKNGDSPHKQICGNKDALIDSVLSLPEYKAKDKAPQTSNEDESDDKPRWPAPQPGYVRSGALQHQLCLLEEQPNLHYVLVRPDPQEDTGVVFPSAKEFLLFFLCMRRAVASYSPREVYRMYQALVPKAQNAVPAFGIGKLKEQLKKEYGVDIDEVHARMQAEPESR